MGEKKQAALPLLGIQEITLLEHTTSQLHDANNDLYLNPVRPVSERDLEQLFLNAPEFPQAAQDYQTIRALGILSEDKTQGMTEEKRREQYRNAANLLASFQRPFSLCFSGSADGSVSFRIGIENDPDGYLCNCYLRASFGYCDYTAAENPVPRAHVWSATCRPIRYDVSDLEHWSVKCPLGSWADAIAAAIVGTDCTVQLFFSPTDGDWIKKTTQDCMEVENALSYYLKHRPQVTANSGQNNVSGENANKIISFLRHESFNSSSNASMSITLSEDYAVHDTELELFEKQLQHRIRLLQQAGESGWFVRFEVSADQKQDNEAEMLRALLSSALQPIGFSCKWEYRAQSDIGWKERASAVLPAYLLPALVCFPTRPFVGFRMRGCSQLELNPPNIGITQTDSLEIGSIVWDGADTGTSMYIPRKEMNRHAIVFGMTGGGKTNTVCSMLCKLQDLHYLVIEPVKGEYHVLPGIQRFNMVAGTCNSLTMNPFWFPPGTRLQYHIDSLKLIISSAFDLYAAMPNILEQCLYRAYSNCGWDIISGVNIFHDELPEETLFPNFQSLCTEVERYLDESAFAGETAGNYRGALLSRLQSFTSGAKGLLLNTSAHIDFQKWSEQNVVVELDALADDADKAIVMGSLLVQYFEYIKSCGGLDDHLKHLFVLEEAHHLFREVPQSREGGANASSQLVNMLNNLLAEIRAYGEGFIIVDQSPSSISTSVLKNTAVKIVHRVDYGEDIKLLQSALLLSDGDMVTASLSQGDALVRFGTMQAPAWIHVPYYPKEQALASDKTEDFIVTSSDRVSNNDQLLNALYLDGERILNTILIETDREIIRRAIEQFQETTRQWTSYYCGWEAVEALTAQALEALLDSCITSAVEQAYPRQYCLQQIIRMFVRRVYELNIDAPMTQQEWDILKDYRRARIQMRCVFYCQNHENPAIRDITTRLGLDADARILRRIVDRLWLIPKNNIQEIDKAYDKIMKELFYERLSDILYAQYKLLTLRYCMIISAEDESE